MFTNEQLNDLSVLKWSVHGFPGTPRFQCHMKPGHRTKTTRQRTRLIFYTYLKPASYKEHIFIEPTYAISVATSYFRQYILRMILTRLSAIYTSALFLFRTKMVLEFYYDLLSQPCRAVYLFLRANDVNFETKLVDLLNGKDLFRRLCCYRTNARCFVWDLF